MVEEIYTLEDLKAAIEAKSKRVLQVVNPVFGLEPDAGGMLCITDTVADVTEVISIGAVHDSDRETKGHYAQACTEWLIDHPAELTSKKSGSRPNAIRCGKEYVLTFCGKKQEADLVIAVRLAIALGLINAEEADQLYKEIGWTESSEIQTSPGQRLADHHANNPADCS